MNKKLIIITGNITSGKTTFLDEIVRELKTNYSIRGFLSSSTERSFRSGTPAKEYRLRSLTDQREYPWAVRRADNSGFDFNEESRDVLTAQILGKKIDAGNEILILDDIGMLEILGNGFDRLLSTAKASPYSSIIVSVKKTVIAPFIKRYSFESALVIDLDEISSENALKKIKSFLYSYDSEKIALYSAICSGVEIGLGSTLHALHVPLKGHFLALVQNFFLIQFAKELKGRNLFWIVFITSALKSFSPAGAKLRPMLYIFIQGGLFILPITIAGLNIFTVILGSILLGLSTLFLSLLIDYITFGLPVIVAYLAAISKFLTVIRLESLSVWGVIIGIILLKIILSTLISLTYYFDFSARLSNLKTRFAAEISENSNPVIKKQTVKESVVGAVGDLFTIRFAIPFILISLIIFFFSGIAKAAFPTVLMRGIILAWFGFLASRRIDFDRIVLFLEKRDLGHVASSLKKTLGMVLRNKR
jgi:nucleoside-triphosphatase THEP1